MDVAFTPDRNFLDRLSSVETAMNEMKNNLVDMDTKMTKIYEAVVGNEKFGQEGIIVRLKKLETDNEKSKALKNKLIGAFMAGGAAWTIVWEFIKQLIHK